MAKKTQPAAAAAKAAPQPDKPKKDYGPRPADLSPQAVWPPRVEPEVGPVTRESDYVVRNDKRVEGGISVHHASEVAPRDPSTRTSSLEPVEVDMAATPTDGQRAQTRERRAPATVDPKGGK